MKTTKLIIAAVMAFAVNAGAEEVDLKSSSFTWKGSKVTGDFHTGPIQMKSATIKDGKGEFVADMNSIQDTTLQGEWNQKLISHLKNEDFFSVQKYPTASLKIEKVDGKNLHGKLTIKDKTHDVVVPYKKEGKVYTGELSFDRTKYGIIYGSGNFFKNLGDKMINDNVTLQFKVVVK